MKDHNLNDKVIVITGGAGLIGRAFVQGCAEKGARVIIADVDEKEGQRLVKDVKGKTGNNEIIFIRCDINNKDNIDGLIKAVIMKYGVIDALVNNAYPRNRNYGKRFEDVRYEDFCENININLGGLFLVTKEIADVMKKQKKGNIINIASIYGVFAPDFEVYKGTKMTMPIEYSAIKGAVVNMTRYLASYLGKYNIRVNAISPGGVFNNQPPGFVKRYSKKVVLGNRMAGTDDICGVLAFLLSDQAGYITGQNIIVDGGWSL
ncbi:SDR family oxidoreductase [Candidatus Woesearchaeota archaeon]|nr:SDR family oxidoreductase [Candidatus Woesearchaeota archaeon]